MWSRRKSRTDDTADGAIVLAVEGMHCGSCGLTIDDAVEEVPGVARATTSFRSGLTEVLLVDDADRESLLPQVLSAVTEAGYRATARPS
jgi:copper chaperone